MVKARAETNTPCIGTSDLKAAWWTLGHSQMPPRRKQRKPFAPQKTAFRAPQVCWDVVLCNQHVAATLGSWRWLWTLAQASRERARSLREVPDAWRCV